jgi:hypothetical protein
MLSVVSTPAQSAAVLPGLGPLGPPAGCAASSLTVLVRSIQPQPQAAYYGGRAAACIVCDARPPSCSG